MKSEANDIYEMLDTLALPVAAQRFAQLSESPELGSYTVYYGKNVPLFQRNGYRKSGAMIP